MTGKPSMLRGGFKRLEWLYDWKLPFRSETFVASMAFTSDAIEPAAFAAFEFI